MGRNATTNLTWRERDGRWMKKYQGRYFYYSAGKGNKTRSESAAKAAFKEWKLSVDNELAGAQHNPVVQWLNAYQDHIRKTYCETADLDAAWLAIERMKTHARLLDQSDLDAADDFGAVTSIKKRVTHVVRALLAYTPKKADVGKVTIIPEFNLDAVTDDELQDTSRRFNGKELTSAELKDLRKTVPERKITTKAPRKPTGARPWNDTPEDPQTVGTLINTFLVSQRQAAVTADISAARYDKLRVVMAKFLEHVGESTPKSQLDNALLNGWRDEVIRQVASKEIAAVTGRDMLAITKRLCNFAYNRGYIDNLPRCLAARGRQDAYTITVQRNEITTADVADVHKLLAIASPKARLVILLGLNCGYGPRDISGILKKEIDWQAGTITRARTKTSKRDKPTIVCFKLWPETLDAIKANLSDHKELAFTTDTGKPMVNESIGDDGIVKRHDAVHSIWFRLTKHAKVKTQLKQLRKLGATTLKEKYPHFVDHYLSHAAGKVSDIHYAATHQAGFDAALVWLRSKVLPSSVVHDKPSRKRR